jgi:integrase
VTKGPEHAGIIRFLSDKERTALLVACKASADPNIHTAVMLALATGARAGNLRALTWDDVDLKRWTLRFVHTKNQQPRYVPLVGPAQAVLKAHEKRDPTGKGWVFKGARDDARRHSMGHGAPCARPLDSSATSIAASMTCATQLQAI